jgi:nucleotide-binding universal stress UspA family protein
MFERILVPLDGSALAEQALPYAQEFARGFSSTLVLLQAVTSADEALRESVGGAMGASSAELAASVARGRAEAEAGSGSRYLDAVKTRLGSQPVEVVVDEGAPAAAILEAVADRGISLVVMATHGRSGLQRAVRGSVADTVLRESKVPVMLIRPTQDSK